MSKAISLATTWRGQDGAWRVSYGGDSSCKRWYSARELSAHLRALGYVRSFKRADCRYYMGA